MPTFFNIIFGALNAILTHILRQVFISLFIIDLGHFGPPYHSASCCSMQSTVDNTIKAVYK